MKDGIAAGLPDRQLTSTYADRVGGKSARVGFHHTVEDYYEVGREKVREYARAVQDAHPVHWRESAALASGHRALVAPLSFIAIPGMFAQRRLFEEMNGAWDLWKTIQTDQRLLFHRPVEAGDRLSCLVSLESYREVRGADVVVTKSQIHDHANVPVMTAWTTLVAQSGGRGDPAPPPAVAHAMPVEGEFYDLDRTVPDLSDLLHGVDPIVEPKPYGAVHFDTLKVGQPITPRVVRISRGNLVNYAGVAGDTNPIHYSDGVADSVGLETAVAHGMQTMGIAGGYVSAFVGDPGAVYEYSVRFTSPVYVPADGYGLLELSGKVKSLDPLTGRGEIALSARSAGRKVFGRAVAKAQFA